jgi:Lon protease-like protein
LPDLHEQADSGWKPYENDPVPYGEDVDEEEDQRLAALAPEVSRLSIDLLRRAVGTYPAERVAQEALDCADEVLDRFGPDGLRVLVMSLACWATVQVEINAHASGRPLQSLLDDMQLTWLEAGPEG